MGDPLKDYVLEIVRAVVREELGRVRLLLPVDAGPPSATRRGERKPRAERVAKVPKPTAAKAGKRAPRGTVEPALRELLTKSKAPHTAEEMVELLAGKGVKVTASGLRLHLDAMVKDGELKVVGTRSAKGRGRAAKIFQPTGLMV